MASGAREPNSNPALSAPVSLNTSSTSMTVTIPDSILEALRGIPNQSNNICNIDVGWVNRPLTFCTQGNPVFTVNPDGSIDFHEVQPRHVPCIPDPYADLLYHLHYLSEQIRLCHVPNIRYAVSSVGDSLETIQRGSNRLPDDIASLWRKNYGKDELWYTEDGRALQKAVEDYKVICSLRKLN